MADHTIACHACGAPFSFDGALTFREECPRCSADLHACLTCRFHDRYVENECREDAAEYVKVKDRRNLCEYYKPAEPSDGGHDEAAAARAKLDALFGGKGGPSTAAPHDEAKRRLDALFKKK